VDYSFLLAIFGSITGFTGLAIHFWRYLQEKPRINIYIPSKDRGEMFVGYVMGNQRNEYNEYKVDTSMFTFYLWVRITNQSDKPITLLEMTLKIHGVGTLTLDSRSTCTGFIPVGSNESKRLTPLLQPIHTLDPYSAAEGYLFFGPFSSIPVNGTSATLGIMTTRKIFKTSLTIKPIPPSSQASI
jgi:hypothetical protein